MAEEDFFQRVDSLKTMLPTARGGSFGTNSNGGTALIPQSQAQAIRAEQASSPRFFDDGLTANQRASLDFRRGRQELGEISDTLSIVERMERRERAERAAIAAGTALFALRDLDPASETFMDDMLRFQSDVIREGGVEALEVPMLKETITRMFDFNKEARKLRQEIQKEQRSNRQRNRQERATRRENARRIQDLLGQGFERSSVTVDGTTLRRPAESEQPDLRDILRNISPDLNTGDVAAILDAADRPGQALTEDIIFETGRFREDDSDIANPRMVPITARIPRAVIPQLRAARESALGIAPQAAQERVSRAGGVPEGGDTGEAATPQDRSQSLRDEEARVRAMIDRLAAGE